MTQSPEERRCLLCGAQVSIMQGCNRCGHSSVRYGLSTTMPSIEPEHLAALTKSRLEVIDSDKYRDSMKRDLQSTPRQWQAEDRFFETHPGGYGVIPWECLKGAQFASCVRAWERILSCIRGFDHARFVAMHKGTPYYFMSMASYLSEDFERALFYIDCAIAEDRENRSEDWMTAPAALFVQLDSENPEQWGRELTLRTREFLENVLKKYRLDSKDGLTLDNICDLFFKPAIEETDAWRSAATALFTFVLEYECRQREIACRSEHGGTNEPFFLHLFKGGLLFETLLKVSPLGAGYEKSTLGELLHDQRIQTRLGLSKSLQGPGNKTFEEIIKMVKGWVKDNLKFEERVVRATWGVRNTTGHNLGWTKVLTAQEYELLFNHLLFACFWAISRLFR